MTRGLHTTTTPAEQPPGVPGPGAPASAAPSWFPAEPSVPAGARAVVLVALLAGGVTSIAAGAGPMGAAPAAGPAAPEAHQVTTVVPDNVRWEATSSARTAVQVTAAPKVARPAARSAAARPAAPMDIRAYAKSLVGAAQFSCLDKLWNRESNWNPRATNPSSGAYGIPQSLPGSKMASAGADWRTNPQTQVRWGVGYIKARYGTPCGAWAHSQATGWY